MTVTALASKGVHYLRIGLAGLAMFQFTIGAPFANAASQPKPQTARDSETTSPIKHVIVIIGENRSFDHVFATYVPKNGQTVWNLLSKGIVNADGTPGPNFALAQQQNASDQASDGYLLSPTKSSYSVLPAPLNGGPKTSYVKNDNLTLAKQSENGLPADYYAYLVTGGSGLSGAVPDTRITNVNSLPPGPFQLTNQSTFTYNAYAQSSVHRFYQMWQQMDCNPANSTPTNPSGCDAALFPFVETTVGAGTHGLTQPSNFSTN